MIRLPDLGRIYPDQCGWMWECAALRYSHHTEVMAYNLTGFRFDARCPDCGYGATYDISDRRAKVYALAGTAREIALDMVGNLDAPL